MDEISAFVDVSAAPFWPSVGMDTAASLPPHILRDARRAALLGTRELVAQERFDALVGILVASGAVPVERAQGMLTALSMTIRRHAGGHAEYRVHEGELRLQADHLERQANQIADAALSRSGGR